MTTPKSPEDIVKEAHKYNVTSNLDAPPDWLRSSLASVLLWASEQMPEKEMKIERWIVCGSCGEKQWEYFSHHSVNGYSKCCGKKNVDSGEIKVDECTERNLAIDDCRTLLINEAKKLTNNE